MHLVLLISGECWSISSNTLGKGKHLHPFIFFLHVQYVCFSYENTFNQSKLLNTFQ